MKPAKTVVWGTVGLLAMGFVLWLALHNHTPRRTMAAATAQVITNPKPSLKVVTIDLYSCKTTAAACIQTMTTGPSGLMP